MGAPNPLVDGVVVEVPLEHDARVPGVRLKVAVQNERFLGAHIVMVQHIGLGNCEISNFYSGTYCNGRSRVSVFMLWLEEVQGPDTADGIDMKIVRKSHPHTEIITDLSHHNSISGPECTSS